MFFLVMDATPPKKNFGVFQDLFLPRKMPKKISSVSVCLPQPQQNKTPRPWRFLIRQGWIQEAKEANARFQIPATLVARFQPKTRWWQLKYFSCSPRKLGK